jgi:hypothetical protein
VRDSDTREVSGEGRAIDSAKLVGADDGIGVSVPHVLRCGAEDFAGRGHGRTRRDKRTDGQGTRLQALGYSSATAAGVHERF